MEVSKSIWVVLKILTFIIEISHAKNTFESTPRYPIHSILKEEIDFPNVVAIGQEFEQFRSNSDQFSEIDWLLMFSDVRMPVRSLPQLLMKCFGALYSILPKSPLRIS